MKTVRNDMITFREIAESAEWQNNATWSNGGSPKISVPLLLGKNDKIFEIMCASLLTCRARIWYYAQKRAKWGIRQDMEQTQEGTL